MAIFSAIAAVFKTIGAALAMWARRVIFKAGETKAKLDAMKEGVKRKDVADKILAGPVRKGTALLDRMRKRARDRMHKDLDE